MTLLFLELMKEDIQQMGIRLHELLYLLNSHWKMVIFIAFMHLCVEPCVAVQTSHGIAIDVEMENEGVIAEYYYKLLDKNGAVVDPLPEGEEDPTFALMKKRDDLEGTDPKMYHLTGDNLFAQHVQRWSTEKLQLSIWFTEEYTKKYEEYTEKYVVPKADTRDVEYEYSPFKLLRGFDGKLNVEYEYSPSSFYEKLMNPEKDSLLRRAGIPRRDIIDTMANVLGEIGSSDMKKKFTDEVHKMMNKNNPINWACEIENQTKET